MAVAVDSVSVREDDSGSSITLAHTVSGSDRLLLVGVMVTNQSTTIDSVAYNGAAMSLVATQLIVTEDYLSVYYLLNPDTGTNNIAIAFSGGSSINGVRGVSLTGVNSTPYDVGEVVKTSVNHNAAISVSVTGGDTDELIIDFTGQWPNNHSTPDAGQTHLGTTAGDGKVVCDSSSKPGDSSPVTMSWTNDASWNTGQIAISVKPVPSFSDATVVAVPMLGSGSMPAPTVSTGNVTILADVITGSGRMPTPVLSGDLKYDNGVTDPTWSLFYMRQQKSRLDAIVGKSRSIELSTRVERSGNPSISIAGLDDDILKHSTEDYHRLTAAAQAALGL